MRKKNKNKDKHIKYQYLIWKSDEGFMHLDRFSKQEVSVFLDDLKKAFESVKDNLEKIEDE